MTGVGYIKERSNATGSNLGDGMNAERYLGWC